MNLEPLHALIREFEGLRLKPYLCPAGVPTIGYGATRYPYGKKVELTDAPITAEDAESLLVFDAEQYAVAALKASPVLGLPWNHQRLCAVADFCYNLGTTRYKASTLKKRVDAGDWEGAQRELGKWVFGGGKKLPGLIKRRAAEAALLEEGR